MSVLPISSVPPRSSRWRRILVVLLVIEAALLFLRLVPSGLVLQLASQVLPTSEKLSWYLTRASGVVAYLTLTMSTVWGLLLSTRLVKEWVPGTLALTMHNCLAWIAVGLSLFHAFVLLFDSYYTYTIADLLIPFTGPYAPQWVGIGTISAYLLLLVSTSFYMRRWIGSHWWRRLHYLTFGAFLMVTLHGFMAGTDSAQLTPIYQVSGGLVLFLTIYRIIDSWQATRIQQRRAISRRVPPQSTAW